MAKVSFENVTKVFADGTRAVEVAIDGRGLHFFDPRTELAI